MRVRTMAETNEWREKAYADFMTGQFSLKDLRIKYKVSMDAMNRGITIKMKEKMDKKG